MRSEFDAFGARLSAQNGQLLCSAQAVLRRILSRILEGLILWRGLVERRKGIGCRAPAESQNKKETPTEVGASLVVPATWR